MTASVKFPGSHTPDSPLGTEPILITASELAAMMQVSVRTLWRLLSQGRILKPIRLGGATRWRRDEVRRWIDQGCPPPSGTQQ
jgi:excisionase family DNA binding protein